GSWDAGRLQSPLFPGRLSQKSLAARREGCSWPLPSSPTE
ncbi:hypothetical protein DBR06_SOUSAS31910021, partial [Sousa chinensis]